MLEEVRPGLNGKPDGRQVEETEADAGWWVGNDGRGTESLFSRLTAN